jgi:hypothetical protein
MSYDHLATDETTVVAAVAALAAVVAVMGTATATDGGGSRCDVGGDGCGNALGRLLSLNDTTIVTTTFLTRPTVLSRLGAFARGRPLTCLGAFARGRPLTTDSIQRRNDSDDVGR